MKNLFVALVLMFFWAAPAAAVSSDEETPPLPQVRDAEIVDFDPMGVWSRSRSFEYVKSEGVQIILVPSKDNFFAYYIPPGYKSGRVMVAVHGTGGNAYEELKDEILMAKEFDYLVVAVNWFKPGKGFFKADDLYRTILEALEYIQRKERNNLDKVAYIGFSRGAAISYETAYLDARGKYRLFDLVIAHSGGIPRDFRVEAKNRVSEPDHFFSKLAGGRLGEAPMKDTAFFLYSGDMDEEWGLRMSESVEYAEQLIKQNGGTVVERVRRSDLGHNGLRKDRALNEKAVRAFIERTP